MYSPEVVLVFEGVEVEADDDAELVLEDSALLVELFSSSTTGLDGTGASESSFDSSSARGTFSYRPQDEDDRLKMPFLAEVGIVTKIRST